MFSLSKVKTALKVLETWLDSSEIARSRRSHLGNLYAIRWRAVAFINHDRVLTNRTLLNPITFKYQPGQPK